MGTARSGTLTADQVTAVDIPNHGGHIEVIRLSGDAPIWVRLDGTDPTVGGNDCHPVLGSRLFAAPAQVSSPQNVRLISAEPCGYTVEAAS